MTETTRTVLIVEDEAKLADMYAATLRETYEVETTYSGEDALARIDSDIDVVLLDRKMPGRSGREVLAGIRDRGFDCPVGMITAVDPDWDIIDIGFDDYLLKPVDMDELHRSVERLLVLGSVDDAVREFVSQTITQAALEGQKSDADLDAHDDYETLSTEVARISTELGDITADLSEEQTELIIETITRNLDVTPQSESSGAF